MKPKIEFPNSSLSFILIMAVGFFIIEIAEGLLFLSFEGVNEVNILLIDALMPTLMIAPFLWWLLKSRTRVEIALKESEERFRTLFEGAPDAIFLADPETGIIIDANSRASELTGRSHREIIGMHQVQLHPPRNEGYSKGTFEEHVKNAEQKEYIRPIENFVLRPDGTEVPIEVLAQMVTIKGRQFLQGIFRDITERKKIEKERERLINAINRSTEGITIANENDRFIYVNPAYARIFGRSQEELIGDTWRKISPPEIIAPTEKGLEETIRKRDVGVFKGEVPGLRKDGSIIPTDVSATGFWDRNGKYQGHVCIVKDITERKRAEEELLKFKLGIERSDEAIFITNIDGSIIYVNPAFERTYGYNREEVLGKTPRIIKSGKLPSEAYKPFWDTLLSKNVVNGELVNKTKDGRLLNIGGSANPILNDKGIIVGFLAIQRDITKAKRADELLRKNMSMLKKAQEMGHIGSWEWDIATNDLVWSDEVYKLYGLDPTKDRPKYDVVVNTMTPDTKDWFLRAIDDALKHGRPFDGEYGLFRPDGTIRYTHTRGEVIRDDEGNPVRMFGMVQDITEHKQAENALRESRDFSEKLIDSLRDGLSVLNKDGVRIKVNKSFCHMTGCAEDELINGKPPFPFWPPEHMKEISEAFEAMMKDTLGETELVFMRKNGERFPVLLSLSYMRDEHGEITNIINSIKDITERKQVEEELKRSKEFSETVLESMNHEISIINVSDFRIIDANRAVLDNLKMEKEELIGKKCFEMIHRQNSPCTFPDNICPVLETRKTGKYSVAEHVHFNKDGSIRYVEVSTSPIKNKNGDVIQVVHISKDITERKQVEKQILTSLKEKEVLLRELHHRVKNNMQIVSSLLWLQSEFIKDKKDLEIFRDSQNRIMSMSLVHERLYRSKDLAEIDTNTYITDLTNNLFQSYGIKGDTIALKISVGNVSLGVDYAIPCGLIINELITNSLKYAFPDSRKGEISICINQFKENIIELAVRDNGVGIPHDVDLRNTKSLGLRLVTILTEEQLHGEISLDRSRGTEFRIKFKGVK